MLDKTTSRRTFLKGTAAAAALACAGSLSFEAWQDARAAAQTATVTQGPSLCNGCSSKCGLIATARDGRLWTLKGHELHPYSKGKLCGRGHGVAQIAYSPDRLTHPLRKNANGEFEPVDWDTAFEEIGEKVKAILADHGPETLACIHDPRPSGKYYCKRFMHALGSANVYTHGAACNISKEAGYLATIGVSNFSVDFGNADMVVFIGRSYGDGIRPSSMASLAAAAERGCRIVMVDPRYNSTCALASDWVPIVPGTDIAFLLALCNVLVERNLYDHDFVEQSTLGFEDFLVEIEGCTPAWAEGVCGVAGDTIEELAVALAKAAPAAAIEPSWRAAFGCAHANSFDTARAVAAVNALLGNWGQKGGALITSSPKAGALDERKFPPVPAPEAKRVGDDDYPLAPSSMGSNLAVVEAARRGEMHGCFFYNSNAVQGYAQPKAWREALTTMDLAVCIDVQMSETALCCDYVLPECSYLERLELPEFIGGKKHFVGLRTAAIDLVHPDTKPCDQIFCGLAEACGVGQYFDFTVEELAEAELETVGVSLEDLKREGVVELEDPGFAYGTPTFKTDSGKFEFTSAKAGEAGLNPTICYTPRMVWPEKDEFFFVGGKQGIHSHTMTMNIEALNAISREYDLERVWINADDAKRLGIEDGDTVEIESSEHTGRVRAKVTQRIMPGVVYTPTHYGCAVPQQTLACGLGICMSEFVPFHTEPGVGATMSQEVAVKVRKVEA